MPEQRRLDRVLEPGYLDGLADRPVDEVSTMKTECTELETEVSFVRRLAQGRIDILDAERDRRANGGLAGRPHRQPVQDPGRRRAPAVARRRPTCPSGWPRRPTSSGPGASERLVGDSTLVRLPDLTDAELADAREQLAALEREVSAKRRALHDVLHTLEMELAERIQAARS